VPISSIAPSSVGKKVCTGPTEECPGHIYSHTGSSLSIGYTQWGLVLTPWSCVTTHGFSPYRGRGGIPRSSMVCATI